MYILAVVRGCPQAVTLLGCMVFGSKLTFDGALFVGMSMLGGFCYSYAKIRDLQER